MSTSRVRRAARPAVCAVAVAALALPLGAPSAVSDTDGPLKVQVDLDHDGAQDQDLLVGSVIRPSVTVTNTGDGMLDITAVHSDELSSLAHDGEGSGVFLPFPQVGQAPAGAQIPPSQSRTYIAADPVVVTPDMLEDDLLISGTVRGRAYGNIFAGDISMTPLDAGFEAAGEVQLPEQTTISSYLAVTDDSEQGTGGAPGPGDSAQLVAVVAAGVDDVAEDGVDVSVESATVGEQEVNFTGSDVAHAGKVITLVSDSFTLAAGDFDTTERDAAFSIEHAAQVIVGDGDEETVEDSYLALGADSHLTTYVNHQVSHDHVVAAGDTLPLSGVVTNTGVGTIPSFTAESSLGVDITNVSAISPGGTQVGAYDSLDEALEELGGLAAGWTLDMTWQDYTVTDEDIDGGSFSSTVDFTGAFTDPLTGEQALSISSMQVIAGDSAQEEEVASLSLVKEVQDTTGRDGKPDGQASEGEELIYTFTVTNDGELPLSEVVISDPKLAKGDITPELVETTGTQDEEGNLSLAPDQTATFRATYVATAQDAESGVVSNTAVAAGTHPETDEAITSDPDSVDIDAPSGQSLEVELKVADGNGDGLAARGEEVTYSYEVTNTGAADILGVQVLTHDLVGDDGEVVSESTPADIKAGQSHTFELTAVPWADGDRPADSISFVAYAEGERVSAAQEASDEGEQEREGTTQVRSADVAVTTPIANPAMTVLAGTETPVIKAAGDDFVLTSTVRNTGDVDLVSLDAPGANSVSEATIKPGEEAVITYPAVDSTDHLVGGVINGEVAGVATVAGSDGHELSGSDTVRVLAAPSLDVRKEVDAERLQGPGQELLYTITVTNTGAAPLENIAVEDPMLERAGIDLDIAGLAGELPPGEKVVFTHSAPYVVTESDFAGGEGKVSNVAKATAEAPEALSTAIGELDSSQASALGVADSVTAEAGVTIDSDGVIITSGSTELVSASGGGGAGGQLESLAQTGAPVGLLAALGALALVAAGFLLTGRRG